MRITTTAVTAFAALGTLLHAAEPQLSPNAPKDKATAIETTKQLAALERAIAPHVAKARKTYPAAKKRYLAGLPPRHVFFLTTRLRDKDGKFEQAFIAVESIRDGKVAGTIANDLNTVRDFTRGQRYIFPETEILDWLISKPDGTEEGNFVGKFMDTYRP